MRNALERTFKNVQGNVNDQKGSILNHIVLYHVYISVLKRTFNDSPERTTLEPFFLKVTCTHKSEVFKRQQVMI